METSNLTLEHEIDCLRNELSRIADQEARLAKDKKLVLDKLLKTRRILTERDNFETYSLKRAKVIYANESVVI